MDRIDKLRPDEKPAPGWACLALGVGYVVLLGLCLIAVRLIAG